MLCRNTVVLTIGNVVKILYRNLQEFGIIVLYKIDIINEKTMQIYDYLTFVMKNFTLDSRYIRGGRVSLSTEQENFYKK